MAKTLPQSLNSACQSHEVHEACMHAEPWLSPLMDGGHVKINSCHNIIVWLGCAVKSGQHRTHLRLYAKMVRVERSMSFNSCKANKGG